VVVDRVEVEVGTDERPQAFIVVLGHAAVGVLDQGDVTDAEHVHRHGQRPEDVLGQPGAGVAQDMRLAEVEADHVEGVDARVHAGHDGQLAARHGRQVPDAVRSGVSLVGREKGRRGVHPPILG
jgi:hypothetical protein